MVIWILILVAFYVSHSFLAANAFKDYVKYLSPSVFRHYRLLYSIVSTVLFGVIIYWFLYQHEYTFIFFPSDTSKAAGVTLLSAGVLLAAYSISRYGLLEFVGFDSITKKNTNPISNVALNTSGLNAIVRHPIYSGILLALLGLLLMIPTFMTLAGILVSLLYLEIGIRLEEKKLIQEFGDSYLQYRKAVKKVIPYIY